MNPWLATCGSFVRDVADALLPAPCAVCGTAVVGSGPPLCALCRTRLPRIPPPWCPRCGATQSRGVGQDLESAPEGCAECQEWPLALPAAAAPFRYAGAAAAIVRGWKYRGWRALTPFMGAEMEPFARRLVREGGAMLVPVPLAPSRERERGFNQARLLADELRRRTGWPVAELLERRMGGRAQSTLGRRARERKVRSAYRLRGEVLAASPGDARGFAESRVLLVDDVVTTGATAVACAGVLAEAEVRCAGVVSFARTLPRPEESQERWEAPAGVV